MEAVRRVIEDGDVFFFYRAKIDVDQVTSADDVQRFFMVLAPRGRDTLRVFVVGRKRLPEIMPGVDHPEERNWLVNTLVTDDVEVLRRELAPATYDTLTRGRREMTAANPVGEGVYELALRGRRAELSYVLELPKAPGPAQEALGIQSAALYIAAVRNPALALGAGQPQQQAPRFPPHLLERFARRNWIEVDDPGFLDVLHAELLLIGGRTEGVAEEVVPALRDESDAATFTRLAVERTTEGLRPLLEGAFPSSESATCNDEPIWLENPPGNAGARRPAQTRTPRRPRVDDGVREWTCTICDLRFTRRSDFERHIASSHPPRAPSASDLTRALKGITFPKTRDELVVWVAEHGASEDVRALAQELPAREYRTAADVAKGLGEAKRAPLERPAARAQEQRVER